MDTLVQSQPHQVHAMTDDDDDKKLRRREQNRLSAQRSYHKKQERLQALRSQVTQLEATYQHQVSAISTPTSPSGRLLAIPPDSASSSPTTSHGDDAFSADEKNDSVSPSSPPMPSSHLQELLSSRSQLQHENDALRRRIDEQNRFQFRLQSQAAGDEASSASGASVQLVHNSVTGSPRFQPRIQMKRPLTVEECYTLGSNAYQHMLRHPFPEKYMTTGSSMCGWTDKRVQENGLLKVELRKTFHGHSIDSVARNAWAAVQDPRKMDTLYSLNMNMHSEIVQRIDDSNVVMYQSYETPERNPSGKETGAVCVMHHVMLLTSFATERGYIILFMSLEPNRLDDSDHIVDLAEEEEAAARGLLKRRHKQWFKKLSWLTLDRVGDSFECAYLFTVPPHHGANYYWPLEIILLILRFEVAAVGPVFLLPSSSELEGEDEMALLHSMGEEEDDALEDEDNVVVIENHAVKIEPLALNRTSTNGSTVEDDMSDLFVELFP